MILSFLSMFRLSYKLKSHSEMLPLDLGKDVVSGVYMDGRHEALLFYSK